MDNTASYLHTSVYTLLAGLECIDGAMEHVAGRDGRRLQSNGAEALGRNNICCPLVPCSSLDLSVRTGAHDAAATASAAQTAAPTAGQRAASRRFFNKMMQDVAATINRFSPSIWQMRVHLRDILVSPSLLVTSLYVLMSLNRLPRPLKRRGSKSSPFAQRPPARRP